MRGSRSPTRIAVMPAVLVTISALGCDPPPFSVTVEVQPSVLTLDIGEEATLTALIDIMGTASVDELTSNWTVDSPNVEVLTPGWQEAVTVRGVTGGPATVTAEVFYFAGEDNELLKEADSALITVLPATVTATIEGVVQDTLNGVGLADVFVQAIGDLVGGLPPVLTDALGRYSIDVTEVDNYSMCAIGAIPAMGVPQRFVNTNCDGEDVDITSSSTEVFNLHIETGYYLAVTGCPCDFTVDPDGPISLTFDYRAWNRSSVPVTTTFIAVGIEGEGMDTALGDNAGLFADRLPGATGTAVLDLTAPSSGGPFAIYARLIPVADADTAKARYNSGFATARERNYIQIGTVTLTAP